MVSRHEMRFAPILAAVISTKVSFSSIFQEKEQSCPLQMFCSVVPNIFFFLIVMECATKGFFMVWISLSRRLWLITYEVEKLRNFYCHRSKSYGFHTNFFFVWLKSGKNLRVMWSSWTNCTEALSSYGMSQLASWIVERMLGIMPWWLENSACILCWC